MDRRHEVADGERAGGVLPGARPLVGFLFIGGAHHMLHTAPVAAALAATGECEVRAFVATAEQERALATLMARLGASVRVSRLPAPRWSHAFGRARPRWSALKVPRLIAARAMLAATDVLVVPERTSTILKRLPGRQPFLVHIPHGAGDRAKGFERRIALFDHVIVAGPKDRARMIASGVVTPDRCSISGYVKLAAIRRCRARTAPAPLFDNDRPVVLYNPHFDPALSSWQTFGRALIEAFRGQDRFNLVVAPHTRLMANAGREERAAFSALAVPGRIIVDPGSALSNDMSYTLGCDIYVGDVSSQVYEFLSTPRPCVFLNRGIEGWRDDPSFAAWHLGEVIDNPANVFAAVERAPVRHTEFIAAQMRAAGDALGPLGADPIAEAMRIIVALARTRVAGQRPRFALAS